MSLSTPVPILQQGYIWVLAAEAMTRSDAVLSLTAGGGATGGVVNAGRLALPNAQWERTVVAGELGVCASRSNRRMT
ncbi:structural cement protein Gp24 [Caballeronia sp. DA-9]|uniref:structural cement protein Gp24 n=1 Tax=Caballeronia sp. DA-9 TaxID=3436237 RepID=UPI003F667679